MIKVWYLEMNNVNFTFIHVKPKQAIDFPIFILLLLFDYTFILLKCKCMKLLVGKI